MIVSVFDEALLLRRVAYVEAGGAGESKGTLALIVFVNDAPGTPEVVVLCPVIVLAEGKSMRDLRLSRVPVPLVETLAADEGGRGVSIAVKQS